MVAQKDPGKFSAKNTDLDKFSHGNFDVDYEPTEASLWVTFRARYKFESEIPPKVQEIVKQRLREAVGNWDKAGVFLFTNSTDALNMAIKIRFRLIEQSKGYHKTVDVESEPKDAAWVGMDLNISQYTSTSVLTHECGHVFGNYDEYHDTRWLGIPNALWYHDNKASTSTSDLMSDGSVFQLRYFDHFRKFVNQRFLSFGIRYELRNGSIPTHRPYTIRRGDTLWSIAEKQLNNATRWREIRRQNNTAFTEAEAKRLKLGMLVNVPLR